MFKIPTTCPTALIQGQKCLSVKAFPNGTTYYRGTVDRSFTNSPFVTKPCGLLQCVPGENSVLGRKGIASVNTYSDDSGKYIEVWLGRAKNSWQALTRKIADRVGDKFIDIPGARQEVGNFIKLLK